MIKIFFLSLIILFSNISIAGELLNIIFLGTGTPRPNINKLGPSILLNYNNEEILLDVGRGTTIRLNQIGNDFSKINNIYISHLHYDHIVGLGDLWLTSNLWQKKNDTNVYGPEGIKKFCDGLLKSYDEDIGYRYKDGNYSKLNCKNFAESSEEKSSLHVKPFRNSHGSVDKSYGFIINYNNKKIIYSADTTYSENLINNSTNCDILIHEIISVSKNIYDNNKKIQEVVASHTSISQLIDILKIAKPKLTILNHALLFGVSESDVLRTIFNEYQGDVIFAKDFMSVDLGEEINIFTIEH